MDREKNIFSDELHGVLLAADKGIDEKGGRFSIIGLFGGITISIVLSTGFLDELLKIDLNSYQNWVVYIGIPIITFFVAVQFKSFSEKKAYLKYRNDVLTIAKKSGYNKYQLIATIEGLKQFVNISNHLKNDNKID